MVALRMAPMLALCWWMSVILDHYSCRVMGFALFRKAPTSVELRSCLGRAIGAAGTTPRYLVSDKGSPFFPTAGYKKWWHHGRTIKEALRWTGEARSKPVEKSENN